MTIIEITLVFDTEDDEYGEVVTMEEIQTFADQLNLDTAHRMNGYQGWRVDAVEE